MISHDTKISYPSADLLQEARAASSASGEAIRRQGDVDQRRPSVGKDWESGAQLGLPSGND